MLVPIWVMREYRGMKENYRILRDPDEPDWRKDQALDLIREAIQRLRDFYGNPNWQPPSTIVDP
jgi:hypothetical protein